MNKSANISGFKIYRVLLVLLLAVVGVFGQISAADKKAQADGLLNEAIGLSAQQTAEARKIAVEKLTEARKLFREIDIKPAEAFCLFMLGQIYQTIGDKPKAIDLYKESLSINRTIPNTAGIAGALTMLGLIYNSTGDKAKALEVYEEAIPIFQNLGDKKSEVVTTTSVCMLYFELNEKQKSLDCHNRMLPFYQQFGDRWGEGLTLNSIGGIYNDFGDLQKAFEYFSRALAIRQSIGDQFGVKTTLNNLGTVFDNLGDKPKALDYYNQALSIARQFGDKIGEAIILINIGKVFKDLGETQKALDFHNQALKINRAEKDLNSEAKTLNNIGETYLETGDLAKGFDFENQALAICRTIADKRCEAVILNNIGGIYAQLGENQKSIEFSNAALPLFRVTGDIRGEANALNSIGVTYLTSAEYQKALDHFVQALPLRQKSGDKAGEAATLGNIGNLYVVVNDLGKAAEFFNRSLALEIAIKDKRGEATALNNLGDVYARLGEKRRSLEQFNKALLLSKTVNDKRGEAITLSNLMLTWNGLGNRRQAILFGKLAANRFQELRNSAQTFDNATQKIFLKSVESTYRNLTEFLLFEKRLPEAQHLLSAFKDEQFFDFDKSRPTRSALIGLTPHEIELVLRYEKTSSAIGTIGTRLDELKRQVGFRQPDAAENAEIQKLENDLNKASDDFANFLKQSETEFSKPADEKDKVSEMPDLTEMQTTLRELSANTGQKAAAVYQLAGEENFHLLVITAEDIKSVSTTVNNTVVNERALDFWALLQSSVYDPRLVGKELYDIVFKPLENILPKDTKTILWSLDGNLRYVPMAALFDGKQYLVERYNHVNFTRADRERMTRAVKPVWTAIGLGTSEAKTVELLGNQISFEALPGVGEELKMLFRQKGASGGIFDGETLRDAKFTRAAMLEALKQKRPLVHIASHFSFRAGDEARSFLLLGDGTAFTLADMKSETNLFQGVELLTLSACNTAAQQTGANGREVDGFAELAQRLGANSVMATLWSVADCSTPWLMREFYDLKLNKNQNKAESLRAAQLGLLGGKAEIKSCETRADLSPIKIVIVEKSEDRKKQTETTRSGVYYLNKKDAPLWEKDKHPPFAHPFYWSPFVLFGNWR